MPGEHKSMLRKPAIEVNVADMGPLVGQYLRLWTVFMERGYQCAEKVVRAKIPKKTPQNRV